MEEDLPIVSAEQGKILASMSISNCDHHTLRSVADLQRACARSVLWVKISIMNLAHLHLVLNHLPIATLIFGFFILIIGRIQRNEGVVRVALGILVVGGFVASASFLTGEPAEDVIKSSALFSEKYVHEHELAAGFGLWSTIITACAAAGGLYLSIKKGVLPKRYLIFVFVLNFWALTVIARTNYLGGLISHPEIRSE